MNIVAVYADGGLMGRVNPSSEGGTWAYCWVESENRRVKEMHGTLTASEAGLAAISNNLTELLAVVRGLQSLPEGWAGKVWTDSRVTLRRVIKGHCGLGTPQWLEQELRSARARLGAFRIKLLAGHPSKAELANGKTSRGVPVSHHNVRCDQLCKEAARQYRWRNG